jgi:mannose-1-phosphate guanylyltransferase
MTETNSQKKYCIILAGGKGRRLWPSSRSAMPKQFIDFFGTGYSLLQQTYQRIAKLFPEDHIYVCTSEEYYTQVSTQLPAVPTEHILLEPIIRNTAPSVAWATDLIVHGEADANVLIVPSDQLILNEEKFTHFVDVGMSYVDENNVLLTMGVKPTRPEPGYGYIQLGDLSCKPDVYKVKSFTEKPERKFAKMFMESGEFYWNTGMFMAKGKYLLRCFEDILPEVLRNLKFEKPDYTYADSVEYIRDRYPYYPNLSIDYAILEQCKNVYVMKCDFGWADIGTWHAIYEAMQKTENDNVVLDSEVMLENCRNNIICLPKGHIGVFNGLEGYIIAEQGDVLLICPKSDSSALIRKYVSEVGIKYGEAYT